MSTVPDLIHTSASDLIGELQRRGWTLQRYDSGTEALIMPAACRAALQHLEPVRNETMRIDTRNGYYIGTVLSQPQRPKIAIELERGNRPELLSLFGRLVGETMEEDAEVEREALLVRVTHVSPDIETQIAQMEAAKDDDQHPSFYGAEQLERLRALRLAVRQEVLLVHGIRLPGKNDRVAFRVEDVIAVVKEDGD